MHIRHWMGAVYATCVSLLLLHTLGQELDILSARDTTPDDLCDGSCYCTNDTAGFVWSNDCGFQMPTEKVWAENLHDDKDWLKEHFHRYTRRTQNKAGRRDAPDRLTFPTYMLKLYAPNVPPSNMLCDSLGMCRVSQTCDVI
jgi:hypothetical protein